jgi:hypothetical protein
MEGMVVVVEEEFEVMADELMVRAPKNVGLLDVEDSLALYHVK